MDTPQSDGSKSVADQFTSAFDEILGKRTILKAASNKRISRWAAVENWMRKAPDGLPYWMITEDCKNLIRTIPLMESYPGDIEDLDTTLEDHAIDSAGYFLQYVIWVDAGKMGGVKYRSISLQQRKSPIYYGGQITLDPKKFEVPTRRSKIGGLR